MYSSVGYRPRSRSSQLSSETAKPRQPSSRSSSVRSQQPHPRFHKNMASVLDLDRSRSRRDRTYIGSECAVCEEPLEHTLRGERVLQLSCSHIAHEACFFEYIKEFESHQCPTCDAPLALDTSRGGNVLDIEKLSNHFRSVNSEPRDGSSNRSAQQTPTPWDSQTGSETRGSGGAQSQSQQQPMTDLRHRDSAARSERSDRLNQRNHARSDSGATGYTGAASSADFADPQQRRHDYDVQAMETSLSSPRSVVRNPIPPPSVTVRSEFPTLSRSRQQQSLTCLVTVEVVEGKWRPDPEDMRGAPPLPSNPNDGREQTKTHTQKRSVEGFYQSPAMIEQITEDLHNRVDNWHGLDFSKFGKLKLHGHVRVGKDRHSWQELECYLFSEMLICVKEKKASQPPSQWESTDGSHKKNKCTLKGSILIKRHLKQVEMVPENNVLTLSLSVTELPSFHLQFQSRNQMDLWQRALLDINADLNGRADFDHDNSGTDEEDYRYSKVKRVSSVTSSYGAGRSVATAPTEYTNSRVGMPDSKVPASYHVPLDIVVVIPVSSSMQGLKITLLRDTLRFLVMNLGERDRMGLVTFGSSGGGVPLVGMTSKTWSGWPKVLESIRPVGQKSLRADVVEGANVAMDLLMQRKSTNPVSSILLISDSSTSDAESVDFVVSRAEAAKVAIHSFGLGLTHKPDTMIELSTRTKASYTYVKDWMMLRECVAGTLGSLQTASHQNVKLKLRLPEGSPAKFVKISGALQITKRATGRDAEAALGDLRFGDKRDILVQLAITPDTSSPEQVPQDAWETIVSGLEALGGPFDNDDQRTLSVEEVPLIQADLTYGDLLREGSISHLPRPSLLAITMLPASSRKQSTGRPPTPPIPPHPLVVQRRMELLTSDMLTRALTLVSRGQHERAHHLLSETRSILKGLGKGGLPPLPPPPGTARTTQGSGAQANNTAGSGPNSAAGTPILRDGSQASPTTDSSQRRTPSPPAHPHPGSNHQPGGSSDGHLSASSAPLPASSSSAPPNPFQPAAGIDAVTMSSLDAELEASLEWINHPAVFGRDSRKAVLQAIGVISSQRGYTFRTPSEALWAERILGVKALAERSREWREAGDEALMEEV